MRKRLMWLALIGGAVPPLAGFAACPAPADGFSTTAGLHAQGLAVDLSGSSVLLGVDGSRVGTAGPPIEVPPHGDLRPAGWMTRVDWRVYGADDIHTAPTLAYRDAEGVLCRLERWTVVRGERVRDGGWAFFHDEAGRSTGYAAYDVRFNEGKPSVPRLSAGACLTRDAAGHVSRFVSAPCGQAGQGEVRYVTDATGTLLRAIDSRPQGLAHGVAEFDANGGLKRRLRLMSAYGENGSVGESPAFVMPGKTTERLQVWRREGGNVLESGIAGQRWEIVRLDKGFARDDPGPESWDPAWQKVVVAGVTNAEGRAMVDPAGERLVDEVLREDPGRVFWVLDGTSRFLLVPGLAAGVWARCVDAENVSAGACE